MNQGMRNLETICLKTKEMLKSFGQENIGVHFTSFPNKKTGVKERRELRQSLIEEIKKHKDIGLYEKDFDWNNLLKIGIKPNCPFASISISHCDYLGVFLIVFNKGVSIGFDMEKTNRITRKLIGRISSKEEIQLSPSLSLLWTAKEASFKCFSDQKESVLLNECFIFDWREEPSKDIYFFKSYLKKVNKKAFGTACCIHDLALAYVEVEI